MPRLLLATLCCLPTLTACAGLPVESPVRALELAEARLTEGDPEAAVALLEGFAVDDFGVDTVQRYKVAYARALLESGDPWKAYRQLEGFTSEFGFSDLTPVVEDIVFEAGRRLITSDWSFWIFASDELDGRVVLEHFLTRYPRSIHAAETLRLLGAQAYEAREFPLAQERYSQLVRDHPDSEWVTLARFRTAMCRVFQLTGPPYDRRAMQLARNELADFLRTVPEDPRFRDRAREALATVTDWLAERELLIADFYRRLDNLPGERLHLERARDDYPGTAVAARAEQRLAALAAVAAQGKATEDGGAGAGGAAGGEGGR